MLVALLVLHFLVVVAHSGAHLAHALFVSPLETAGIVLVYFVLPIAALVWRAQRGSLAWWAFALGGLHSSLRHFVIPSADRIDAVPRDAAGYVFIVTAFLLVVIDIAGVSVALRPALHEAIGRTEKRLGSAAAYLHDILDVSYGAFFRFYAFVRALPPYRRVVPKAALHIARLVSTRAADCGTCVQTAVNIALADQVPPDVVRAALADDVAKLPDDLALIHRFASASLVYGPEAGVLRDEVTRRYGKAGLVELAFAVASSQVYPRVKQVMGQAHSCARAVVTMP